MTAFARCCALLLFFLLSQALPGWAAKPVLTLVLRPTYAQPDRADGLAVAYTLTATTTKPRPLDLQFDTMAPYLVRGTDVVTNLVVTDARGPVAFAKPVVRPQDGKTIQHWQARRLVTGTVHVAYRVPVAQAEPAKRGPHLDLQAAGGGVAGAGIGFLLLPALPEGFTLRLSWQLPAGATAISSFGPGSQSFQTSSNELFYSHFLAGPLYHYPAQAEAVSQGFSAAGLGRPAAEMDPAMAEAKRVYEVQRQAFGGSATKSFKFFFRSYPGSLFPSGNASAGVFLMYLPPSMPMTDLQIRATVAHEIVHGWDLFLKAPDLVDQWYSEGIADYFALTLPYAAGLYTPAEYLEIINQDASYYYTNSHRLTPDRDVPGVMWTGPNTWTLSYARGMLYFANLDAKLRQAGSPHTVLSFANELLQLARAGHEPTARDWVALLRREAGDWAVADWQAMVEGQLLRPVPGAFGPGVVSQPVKVGFFDLGFTRSADWHIKTVVPGSAAEQAGLREGDQVKPFNLLPVYGSFRQPLMLDVQRGAERLAITFLPQSGQAEAWEWVAAPGAMPIGKP